MFHRPLALVVVLGATLSGRVAAQIPETFTNLHVLPKDITRQQLLRTMRGFALGLGVNCSHCHVGRSDGSLEGMDFASDSQVTKRTARVMLQMVQAINGEYLSQVQEGDDRLEVQCATCHRGVTRPEPLDRIVARTVRTDGLAAAVAEYKRLRDEYYGSGPYDFGEQTLIDAAIAINSPTTRREGLDLLTLNLEFHAQSANTHAVMGQIQAAMGDTAAAIASLERALAIRPGDAFITRQLARLRP